VGRKAAKNVGRGFALESANGKMSRVRPSEEWGSVEWGNPVIGNKRAEGPHEQSTGVMRTPRLMGGAWGDKTDGMRKITLSAKRTRS
jgi:hypothetical protein